MDYDNNPGFPERLAKNLQSLGFWSILIEDPRYDSVIKQRVCRCPQGASSNIRWQVWAKRPLQNGWPCWKEADIVHDTLGHYSDMYQCEQAKANDFTHSYDYGMEEEVVLVKGPTCLVQKAAMHPLRRLQNWVSIMICLLKKILYKGIYIKEEGKLMEKPNFKHFLLRRRQGYKRCSQSTGRM